MKLFSSVRKTIHSRNEIILYFSCFSWLEFEVYKVRYNNIAAQNKKKSSLSDFYLSRLKLTIKILKALFFHWNHSLYIAEWWENYSKKKDEEKNQYWAVLTSNVCVFSTVLWFFLSLFYFDYTRGYHAIHTYSIHIICVKPDQKNIICLNAMKFQRSQFFKHLWMVCVPFTCDRKKERKNYRV